MVNRDGKDGKVWQCGRPCRKRVSIWHGSFFDKSNLTIEKSIRFIYLWAHELLSVKTAKREFKISNSTVVDWKSFKHIKGFFLFMNLIITILFLP